MSWDYGYLYENGETFRPMWLVQRDYPGVEDLIQVISVPPCAFIASRVCGIRETMAVTIYLFSVFIAHIPVDRTIEVGHMCD